MDNLKLDGNLSFGIESYSSGLRLMVFDSDEVWVCHKVRVKDLKGFLQAESAHLFKGRLQMDKVGNDITINVKDDCKGSIGLPALEGLLKQL